MKNKFVFFESILAVFLILLVPSIPAVETNLTVENYKTKIVELYDYHPKFNLIKKSLDKIDLDNLQLFSKQNNNQELKEFLKDWTPGSIIKQILIIFSVIAILYLDGLAMAFNFFAWALDTGQNMGAFNLFLFIIFYPIIFIITFIQCLLEPPVF